MLYTIKYESYTFKYESMCQDYDNGLRDIQQFLRGIGWCRDDSDGWTTRIKLINKKLSASVSPDCCDVSRWSLPTSRHLHLPQPHLLREPGKKIVFWGVRCYICAWQNSVSWPWKWRDQPGISFICDYSDIDGKWAQITNAQFNRGAGGRRQKK